MINIPDEIKKMEEEVKPYRKNAVEFIDDTPDYILEMDKKIDEFYIRESEMV